jgi:hypothetical protein
MDDAHEQRSPKAAISMVGVYRHDRQVQKAILLLRHGESDNEIPRGRDQKQSTINGLLQVADRHHIIDIRDSRCRKEGAGCPLDSLKIGQLFPCRKSDQL